MTPSLEEEGKTAAPCEKEEERTAVPVPCEGKAIHRCHLLKKEKQDMLWQWTGTIHCTSRTMFHKRIWTLTKALWRRQWNACVAFLRLQQELGSEAKGLGFGPPIRVHQGQNAAQERGNGWWTTRPGFSLMTWIYLVVGDCFGRAFGFTISLSTPTSTSGGTSNMLWLPSPRGTPWSQDCFFPIANAFDKRMVEMSVGLSLWKGVAFFPIANPVGKREVEMNLGLSLVKTVTFFPVTNYKNPFRQPRSLNQGPVVVQQKV